MGNSRTLSHPAHPSLLIMAQAASKLACSPAAIRKWLAQGRLARVNVGRLTRLRLADVEAIAVKGLPEAKGRRFSRWPMSAGAVRGRALILEAPQNRVLQDRRPRVIGPDRLIAGVPRGLTRSPLTRHMYASNKAVVRRSPLGAPFAGWCLRVPFARVCRLGPSLVGAGMMSPCQSSPALARAEGLLGPAAGRAGRRGLRDREPDRERPP